MSTTEGIAMTTETPETAEEHDGLTHLVDAEDAVITTCGLERTIWVSATQTTMFATCSACVEALG